MKFKLNEDLKLGSTVIHEGEVIEVIDEKEIWPKKYNDFSFEQ
jgi:hypothetical protein